MLQAEEQASEINIDQSMEPAIQIHGDFQYELAYSEVADAISTSRRAKLGENLAKLKERIKSPLSTPNPSNVNLATEESPSLAKLPFAIRDVALRIPKGVFHVFLPGCSADSQVL